MLTTRKIGYFLKHGTRYEPTICPGVIIRGRIGDCFDASLMNVLVNGFTYVEGIARNPLDGQWIHHAWVTDGTGKAYDPTWKAMRLGVEVLLPTEYVGIPLKAKGVINFIRETEYKALFENGWRSPLLYKLALPENIPAFEFLTKDVQPATEENSILYHGIEVIGNRHEDRLPDRPINHERD